MAKYVSPTPAQSTGPLSTSRSGLFLLPLIPPADVFDFAVDVRDGFRRNGIKRVMCNSLIADAWSQRNFDLRYNLIASFYS